MATFAALALFLAQCYASISHIPSQDTYLLPSEFSSNVSASWTGSTNTSNATMTRTINDAQNVTVIVYDPSFTSIVGSEPQFNLIAQGQDGFAAEGGAWAWDRNEVWFSSFTVVDNATYISILNLTDNTVSRLNSSGAPIPNPNGAYYFNRTIYFTTAGNADFGGGVVQIDPETKVATTVLDSYFGLRFNFPDDAVWVRRGGYSYLFFTDLGAGSGNEYPATADFPALQLQNAIWRFDPQTQVVRPVISRGDIAIPNGVRANAEGTKLYAGDYSYSGLSGVSNSSWSSGAVYEFELDDQVLPVNKRMFSLARTMAADGMHLDDAGRVWTAEGDGIWVRNVQGKALGVINAAPLLESGSLPPIANFALAGDVLIVLAQSRIWRLDLPQSIVAPDNLS